MSLPDDSNCQKWEYLIHKGMIDYETAKDYFVKSIQRAHTRHFEMILRHLVRFEVMNDKEIYSQ